MSTTAPATAPLPLHAPPIQSRAPGAAGRLRRRAAAVLVLVWLVGALPAVLRLGLGWAIPPWVEAFGWGLWLPGAGFLAVGGWWLLMVPVVWIVFEVAMFIWAISGMLAAPLAIWLGAAAWASGAAGPAVFPPTAWLVPMLGVAVVLWKILGERREQAREVARGRQRAQELPGLLADLEERAGEAPNPTEMDPAQMSAARYLFDLSLQPVGELKGFTLIDNFQSASVRYQLNYLS